MLPIKLYRPGRNAFSAAFTVMLVVLMLLISSATSAQKKDKLHKKADEAAKEFAVQTAAISSFSAKVDTVIIDSEQKTFFLKMADGFSDNPFREANTKDYYSLLKDVSGRRFRKYNFSIETMGKEISNLIPNYYRIETSKDASRLSVQKETGSVLVENSSKNTTSASKRWGRKSAN